MDRLEKISPGTTTKIIKSLPKQLSPERSLETLHKIISISSREVVIPFSGPDLELARAYLVKAINDPRIKITFSSIARALGRDQRTVGRMLRQLKSLGIIRENFLIDYSYFHLGEAILFSESLLSFEKDYSIFEFPLSNRNEKITICLIPSNLRETWKSQNLTPYHGVRSEKFSINISVDPDLDDSYWTSFSWDRPINRDDKLTVSQNVHGYRGIEKLTEIPKLGYKHAVLLDLLHHCLDTEKIDEDIATEEDLQDLGLSNPYLRKKLLPKMIAQKTISKIASLQNVGLNSFYGLFVVAPSSTINKISRQLTKLPIAFQYLSLQALFAVLATPPFWELDFFNHIRKLKERFKETQEFILSPLPPDIPLPFEPTNSFAYKLPQHEGKANFFTSLFDKKFGTWSIPAFLR